MTSNATVESAIGDKWSASIHEYFAVADRWEFDSFATYLSPDVKFRFGNNEPINGREDLVEFARQHKPMVKSVQHRLDHLITDVDQRTVVVELQVTYTRHDDGIKQYPATVVIEFDAEDLISRYRVYVDLAGLF